MKKNDKNIIIVILIMLSIYNICCAIHCFKRANPKKEEEIEIIPISPREISPIEMGGLGSRKIYKLGFIAVLVLQFINIGLLIFLLKNTKKAKVFLIVSALIVIGTYFIPVYRFAVDIYLYNNIYEHSIFEF